MQTSLFAAGSAEFHPVRSQTALLPGPDIIIACLRLASRLWRSRPNGDRGSAATPI